MVAAQQPSAFVLASGSPRRRHLLETAGFQFEIKPAQVEEHEDLIDGSPERFVLANAELKASYVAKQVPRALVLGSDTTVSLEDRILNKPGDLEDAARMIGELAGRSHTVFTAFCLQWIEGGLHVEETVASRVVFKSLSRVDIDRYFTVVNPLDKAGAYGIQEGKDMIIDHFEGSLTNIMGLPMEALEASLEKLGLLNLFRATTV